MSLSVGITVGSVIRGIVLTVGRILPAGVALAGPDGYNRIIVRLWTSREFLVRG